ncbi:TetR/AcrR family transcriptional regulator [Ectobacillus antri]|jgi:AcrR family transcriptional regulator|uniref:TetR/AcrR family transcriptional regulator n=1 Tax=Ectobacillus antri TaxID=2486280 RepID=A0ABT6H9B5_9BACI|nr:TetR/AcrR family transcriptional regulator [Ectobacillus antri]MDG4658453.1 TetR/AcrR family transcriptional regulator [Ectobacillus antri]MDG5755468.1 TetR/AcrR family transcriptional regulator [Ectobacillus antri]
MTADQIKKVSIKYFAQNGYEGASLAQIAEAVGIKKQSIYTHFKGKDELFLQICKEGCDEELRFVMEFIESNKTRPIKEFLYDFLLQCIDRYEKYDSTKFWLRTAFFPPSHLNGQVMEFVYDYLDKLEKLLLPVMEKAMSRDEISTLVGEQRATTAFLALLDSIWVEMFYGGMERLQKRLDSSWYVYWRGISSE